ncbi:MAG: site-2 protease family protein [Gammaproteobacteria bacterium]|nr:MAG: site-2 protease family protein [Gammaproteobacteria bacterium]RLA20600.1 MAG: site-2 protease family protein [Gammaproteobacteria bacterium]
MNNLSSMQVFAVWVLPVLFAITVHEVAHGWVAKQYGDRTAEMLGRLTLNPLKHIDPIGTILVPGVLLLMGGFVFGWAKPVPINPRNLRSPKRDMAIVAVAGPIANLLMALFWALIIRIGTLFVGGQEMIGLPLIYMGSAGISINIFLMMLNLLPIPPLDGGRVLAGFLPGPLAYKLNRLEPYGFMILIALIYFGGLSLLLGPPVYWLQKIMFTFAGI